MKLSKLIQPGDLGNAARGFMMGGADIIPGVSGGTVALILGIYNRLVTAISRFDLTFLTHVRSREWSAAAMHVDLRFLVSLAFGIGTGIVSLASLMHYLLERHLLHTYAVFFGLIFASTVLVAKMVKRWSPVSAACLVAGFLIAFWLVGPHGDLNPPEGNLYVFFCGTIAVCAMILPGISGAFVLLLLGMYHDITGILRDTLHFDFTAQSLVTLATFMVGCAVGLLSFAKFLRWLLARCEAPTMAVLCGFLAGSLRKIWPFKIDLKPEVEKVKLKKFENVWPEAFDFNTILVILLVVAALGFVFAMDWFTSRRNRLKGMDESGASQASAEPAA